MPYGRQSISDHLSCWIFLCVFVSCMYECRQLLKATEVLVGGALIGMGCRYDKFEWPRRPWASGMQLGLEEPLGF